MFLIHFHLTHQNVALEKLFEILVSYIFFPPNFSLLVTYFPNSRNSIFLIANDALHRFESGSEVRKAMMEDFHLCDQWSVTSWALPGSPAGPGPQDPQGSWLLPSHKWSSFSKIARYLNKCFCQSIIMLNCLTWLYMAIINQRTLMKRQRHQINTDLRHDLRLPRVKYNCLCNVIIFMHTINL